ncbi:hypothetical protein B9Z19DRAFT_1090809 [Tuber borchii]|uniref:Uncharacterized protein n=1 Tax=Tuber borchii TaxID=42251 RepID=A0A2T6ZIF1_TUBBO|nr:hypothetical protein B9Z19DRAFT_1090809 [Tuber borchii]
MTGSPPTAPNTMATSETGIETPAQRQPEGRYRPPDFEEVKHDPPYWLMVVVMCGCALVLRAVFEEKLHPLIDLYVEGLTEWRLALSILCYAGYLILLVISLILCMLTACGLVEGLWFLVC